MNSSEMFLTTAEINAGKRKYRSKSSANIIINFIDRICMNSSGRKVV